MGLGAGGKVCLDKNAVINRCPQRCVQGLASGAGLLVAYLCAGMMHQQGACNADPAPNNFMMHEQGACLLKRPRGPLPSHPPHYLGLRLSLTASARTCSTRARRRRTRRRRRSARQRSCARRRASGSCSRPPPASRCGRGACAAQCCAFALWLVCGAAAIRTLQQHQGMSGAACAPQCCVCFLFCAWLLVELQDCSSIKVREERPVLRSAVCVHALACSGWLVSCYRRWRLGLHCTLHQQVCGAAWAHPCTPACLGMCSW